ncbi:hypothetical protein PybrP1_009821 [[Pythium] brassicae (nom. inval.)]|nr:hypothetical protein PybrP1_009821 [[Pythium] brassicae (nom. inval.)]
MLRRIVSYVVYERNPLVQLIYVTVMTVTYFLFVTEAHPLIPNVYAAAYHKWIAAALFVTCSALYAFMCSTDPGVIRAGNVDTFTQYPSHPVLFPEGKFCRTCKTPKIPRSKHCRMCDHCVARFDHQYVDLRLRLSIRFWFNGCVGEKNYRYFIVFLLVQLALCTHVFYLASGAFLVLTEPLLAERQNAPDFHDHRTEMTAALQHIIATNQSLGFVAAISLMIGLVVWLFVLMQLRRIALNTTANESFKRDDLYEAAELDGETAGRRLFSTLLHQLRRQVRKPKELPRSERKKALDASWGGMFSADVILNTEASFSASDVKFNPYDLGGFWRNLQDALQVKSSPEHSHSHSHGHNHSHSHGESLSRASATQLRQRKTKKHD